MTMSADAAKPPARATALMALLSIVIFGAGIALSAIFAGRH